MSLPFHYEALADRFAIIRPWAKQAVAEGVNRCTICMAYTLQIAPSEGNATITTLGDPEFNNRLSRLGKVRFGPSPTSAVLGGSASAPYSSYFFIRASELVPAVKRCYGQPDVQGRADEVWQEVMYRKGVMYLDNCYQTEGDKRLSAIKWLYEPQSGCHWDLFDGYKWWLCKRQWPAIRTRAICTFGQRNSLVNVRSHCNGLFGATVKAIIALQTNK